MKAKAENYIFIFSPHSALTQSLLEHLIKKIKRLKILLYF